MILLAFSSLPVLMGMAVLLWQSRSKVSVAPLVLAMAPIALILLIAPIPAVALSTIRAFQSIAATGSAGAGDAPRFALNLMTPIFLGNVAFIISMWVVAAFQAFAPEIEEDTAAPPPSAS